MLTLWGRRCKPLLVDLYFKRHAYIYIQPCILIFKYITQHGRKKLQHSEEQSLLGKWFTLTNSCKDSTHSWFFYTSFM